jgi:alpha-amylase
VPPRISLALAIHNHQPVGNFGWVFAEVYEQAYLPMLEAVERHPGVHLSLHYTGALLEWLTAERPQFIERLRALIDRGQVELLGGGYYEPVLASLPERDRIGQLRRMGDEIERIAGRRPRGAWLAERVWEPDLPTSLATAGYEWTILDDAHFRAASIPEDALWGAYTTDDQGHILTVFGTEQGLRYRIPFGEVEDVIAYLRRHATEEGNRVGMMGDDGEKFGAWPTTWEHCWGSRRWVDRFFTALEENADWLTTVTPSAWLDREPPIGRVYVPTGSYAEMGEWALPPDEGLVFATILHEAVAQERPEARWLRGGFWRNFQVKYREINDLHKQMLRVSDKVVTMQEGPAKQRALDHLYQGQSNDCYWHGLFGGIYISHMRLATYEHLIAAEDAADSTARAERRPVDGGRLVDVDLDGVDEVLLTGTGQVVTVKPAEGAGIGGWDIRAARHALGAVMRRRPEAYHQTLVRHEDELARQATEPDLGHPASSAVDTGPASIHDLVTTKEAGLAARLAYDWHERRSGVVHVFERTATPDAVARATQVELGDFVDRPFAVDELSADRVVVSRDGRIAQAGRSLPTHIRKELVLGGGRRDPGLSLSVTVENRSDAPVDALLGIEWDLTMLGGGGNPAAYHLVAGERFAHDSSGARSAVASVEAGNTYIGLSVTTALQPPADIWWAPIETISNSESGFERIYQGSSTVFVWPLRVAPGERTTVAMNARVATTRDHAAEEEAET